MSDHWQMLCKIGTTDAPFAVSEYSTLGGISSYDFLSMIPSSIRSFNIDASTASVMLCISRRNSLYRNFCFADNTHMIRDFHFPPNIARPYSSGHRISSSNFFLYFPIYNPLFHISISTGLATGNSCRTHGDLQDLPLAAPSERMAIQKSPSSYLP